MFADDARNLKRIVAVDLEWRTSCKQRVKQSAQGINVRRRGDNLSADLLGARVFGRHHPLRGARQSRVFSDQALRLNQLGNAKIQKLG